MRLPKSLIGKQVMVEVFDDVNPKTYVGKLIFLISLCAIIKSGRRIIIVRNWDIVKWLRRSRSVKHSC